MPPTPQSSSSRQEQPSFCTLKALARAARAGERPASQPASLDGRRSCARVVVGTIANSFHSTSTQHTAHSSSTQRVPLPSHMASRRTSPARRHAWHISILHPLIKTQHTAPTSSPHTHTLHMACCLPAASLLHYPLRLSRHPSCCASAADLHLHLLCWLFLLLQL